MKKYFYSWYMFKDPIYLIAWNVLLAVQTFRRLSKTEQERVTNNTLKLIASQGIDPMAQMQHFEYCCVLAYGLIESGYLPNVGNGSAKWYPIDDPAYHIRLGENRKSERMRQARADIESKFGIRLDPDPSPDISFEDYLYGDDQNH